MKAIFTLFLPTTSPLPPCGVGAARLRRGELCHLGRTGACRPEAECASRRAHPGRRHRNRLVRPHVRVRPAVTGVDISPELLAAAPTFLVISGHRLSSGWPMQNSFRSPKGSLTASSQRSASCSRSIKPRLLPSSALLPFRRPPRTGVLGARGSSGRIFRVIAEHGDARLPPHRRWLGAIRHMSSGCSGRPSS